MPCIHHPHWDICTVDSNASNVACVLPGSADVFDDESQSTVALMAESRTIVPRLLSEVRRLRKENQDQAGLIAAQNDLLDTYRKDAPILDAYRKAEEARIIERCKCPRCGERVEEEDAYCSDDCYRANVGGPAAPPVGVVEVEKAAKRLLAEFEHDNDSEFPYAEHGMALDIDWTKAVRSDVKLLVDALASAQEAIKKSDVQNVRRRAFDSCISILVMRKTRYSDTQAAYREIDRSIGLLFEERDRIPPSPDGVQREGPNTDEGSEAL